MKFDKCFEEAEVIEPSSAFSVEGLPSFEWEQLIPRLQHQHSPAHFRRWDTLLPPRRIAAPFQWIEGIILGWDMSGDSPNRQTIYQDRGHSLLRDESSLSYTGLYLSVNPAPLPESTNFPSFEAVEKCVEWLDATFLNSLFKPDEHQS